MCQGLGRHKRLFVAQEILQMDDLLRLDEQVCHILGPKKDMLYSRS